MHEHINDAHSFYAGETEAITLSIQGYTAPFAIG